MPSPSNKSENTNKGIIGENLAVDYLLNKGYKILCRNYRYSHSEIDIICTNEIILIFVEVKLRNSIKFGFPEQSINAKKEEMIRAGAEQYIIVNNWKNDIRFDIIAIENSQNSKNTYSITHFEDVFC